MITVAKETVTLLKKRIINDNIEKMLTLQYKKQFSELSGKLCHIIYITSSSQ